MLSSPPGHGNDSRSDDRGDKGHHCHGGERGGQEDQPGTRAAAALADQPLSVLDVSHYFPYSLNLTSRAMMAAAAIIQEMICPVSRRRSVR
jgi:hypothetical protein